MEWQNSSGGHTNVSDFKPEDRRFRHIFLTHMYADFMHFIFGGGGGAVKINTKLDLRLFVGFCFHFFKD